MVTVLPPSQGGLIVAGSEVSKRSPGLDGLVWSVCFPSFSNMRQKLIETLVPGGPPVERLQASWYHPDQQAWEDKEAARP